MESEEEDVFSDEEEEGEWEEEGEGEIGEWEEEEEGEEEGLEFAVGDIPSDDYLYQLVGKVNPSLKRQLNQFWKSEEDSILNLKELKGRDIDLVPFPIRRLKNIMRLDNMADHTRVPRNVILLATRALKLLCADLVVRSVDKLETQGGNSERMVKDFHLKNVISNVDIFDFLLDVAPPTIQDEIRFREEQLENRKRKRKERVFSESEEEEEVKKHHTDHSGRMASVETLEDVSPDVGIQDGIVGTSLEQGKNPNIEVEEAMATNKNNEENGGRSQSDFSNLM